MNKLMMSIAGFAIVLATTSFDAHATGVAASAPGWNSAPGAAPASARGASSAYTMAPGGATAPMGGASMPGAYTMNMTLPGGYTLPGASMTSGHNLSGSSGTGGLYNLPSSPLPNTTPGLRTGSSAYGLPGAGSLTGSLNTTGAHMLFGEAGAVQSVVSASNPAAPTTGSNVHMSTFANSTQGAGVISGYGLPSTANGTSGTYAGSTPLHLNSNGTFSHGVAPGSIATNGSLSMLTSQTMMSAPSPGTGNSGGSVDLEATTMLTSITHVLTHALDVINNVNSIDSTGASTSVTTPKTGFQPPKACIGVTGTSVACN